MVSAPQNYLAVIKVVGVGGGGVNAVNRMIDAGLKGVEFIAVNTDAQALLMSDADVKLDIGRELTRGLGAGSDPEVGRAGRRGAPRGDRGGRSRAPTWCSSPRARAAAPAPAARRSSPRSPRASARSPSASSPGRSRFEGRRRSVQAEQGIQKLKEKVDTLIVIPNDRLLTVSNDKTSRAQRVQDGRRGAAAGRAGHHRPHHHAGPHQHRLRRREDDHDQRRLGADGHRLRPAATAAPSSPPAAAISSPLLEAAIEGARGILLNITGGRPTSACSRSTRRPRSSTASRTPTPTSSSAR